MNKRRLIVTILLSFIVVGIVIAAIWFFIYRGINVRVEGEYIIEEYEDGKISTHKDWEWSPNKNNKIKLIFNNNLVGLKRNVALHIEGTKFIDIGLPDKEYIIDYDKSVYAVDGSYCIRLVRELDTSKFDYTFAEKNSHCLVSDNEYGPKIIVGLLDDCSLIVEVYENDIVYSTLLDSMLKKLESKSIKVCNYLIDSTKLNQIVYAGKYKSTLSDPEVNLRTHRYLYQTGFLWEQSWVRDINSIKTETIARLQSLSNNDITEYYAQDDIFYARAGDYYLGLIKVNGNTTISYLGKGEEAKCNIIAMLQNHN